jgi:hypothetical protein
MAVDVEDLPGQAIPVLRQEGGRLDVLLAAAEARRDE